MGTVAVYPILPFTRFRAHQHDTVHLCAVLAGGFAERHGKSTVDVRPGAVRVSPAASHRIDFGADGARCLLLDIDPDAIRAPARSRFLAGDRRLSGLAFRIDRALVRSDGGRDVAVEGLTTELLAQVQRRLDGKRLPAPAWLDEIRARLHDEPAPPSVSQLAVAAGVHRVHLARAFRDHFGVSVTAYGRRLRLERALADIDRTDLPLSLVAARAGFADQSHLTRAVRAATGSPPAALRRRRMLHRFKTRGGIPQ